MRSRLPLLAVLLTGCPSCLTRETADTGYEVVVDYMCYRDLDGDGFGSEVIDNTSPCGDWEGFSNDGGDCDDDNPDVNPGLPDRCDRVDRSCDGAWTPSVPGTCATLAEGLAIAQDGETVLVGPGTYSGPVDFGGKAIALIGQAGAAQTTLQGDGSGSVVRFTNGEGASSVLQGFTVSGGLAEEGGGVLVEGASPTLRDLVITGNHATRGGGLALRSSSATLERVELRQNLADGEGGGLAIADCTALDLHNLGVYGNQAQRGGGLVWESSTGTLTNAFGAGNHAAASGGFALLRGQGAVLQQLSLVGNSAELGGALALEGASAQVGNSVLAGNFSTSGPSVYATDATLDLRYSDSFEATAPAFVGLPDPTGSAGNLAEDPLFVDISAPPEGLRVLYGSPLRDAGDPAVLDADGTRSNMGAFGGPYGSWP